MISPGFSLGPILDRARRDEWRASARRAWRAQIATAAIGVTAAVFLAGLLTREAWRVLDLETQLRAIEAAHARPAPPRPLTFDGDADSGISYAVGHALTFVREGREVWRSPPCDETRAGLVVYFEGTTYLCGADSWWRPAFTSSTTRTDWRP